MSRVEGNVSRFFFKTNNNNNNNNNNDNNNNNFGLATWVLNYFISSREC